MATVNLGAIKFNWKGAYNNSTAYVVDDVVSSSGSSYVCILASQGNAVSNGTYWNIMSSAGTNGTDGTDLTSTLTTRGDIVFKGASALTRLPKGSTGQVLKQGANDPEWGTDVGGKIGQVIHTAYNGYNQQSSIVNTDVSTNLYITITPSATNSKILVFGHATLTPEAGYGGFGIFFTREISGGSTTTIATGTGGGNAQQNYHSQVQNVNSAGSGDNAVFSFDDSPNTTSAVTYRLRLRGVSGTGNIRVGGNNDTTQKFITPFTAMEILA